MLKKLLNLISVAVLIPNLAWAELGLESISSQDMEALTKDFSANFIHTTVSGAAPEGNLFGFQIGLMGGITKTPSLKDLSNEAGEDEVDGLPHGAIVGILSVPFGITLEANILPSMELEGGDFDHMSLAVKWTAMELAMIKLAARLSHTQTSLSFVQEVSGVPTTTDFENTITSLGGLISFSVPVIEPYLGLAMVKTDGKLTATTSVFSGDLSGSTSGKADPSGTHIFAGLELDLLFFNLGFEVGKLFDSTRTTAKFTFGF